MFANTRQVVPTPEQATSGVNGIARHVATSISVHKAPPAHVPATSTASGAGSAASMDGSGVSPVVGATVATAGVLVGEAVAPPGVPAGGAALQASARIATTARTARKPRRDALTGQAPHNRAMRLRIGALTGGGRRIPPLARLQT